ncbi:hypothetical protein LMG19282_00484 [Cupriavidus campinensis]|uniref:Fimbrial protein n=1 Tax=Cupriavidus campinensis TaxID=151783 RepID=A0AAE9I390_9BURK|nr:MULTISPECIES: fimbrial protein [Cupriavidus]TSP12640.1 fimbrial protein [Cupriavidus campinensis]URF06948.1 fimbrial protein [Cupriavidus campinensis]CAG2131460.1 hypothetical protein LMG19282_00484 [Cupriavidus campinensis]
MKGYTKGFAVLLGLGLLLPAAGAMAACSQVTQADIDEWTVKGLPNIDVIQKEISFHVTFPSTIDVQPDLPVGETFGSGASPSLGSSTALLNCDWRTGGQVRYAFVSPKQGTAFPGVVESGMKGIGMRLSYVRGSGTVSTFPFIVNFGPAEPNQPYFPGFRSGLRMVIDFVKTGEMDVSSTFGAGDIATAMGDGAGGPVIRITTGSTRINVLPSCSPSTPTRNIDFGTFGANSVSQTVGPTRPINFEVTCIGPASPSSITAKLTGTPDTENPSLLRNTGAQHLGIRVKDRDSDTVLRPNDNASVITKPGNSKLFTYNLDATVLRTGTQTPTAGLINATAVFTMAVN